MEGPGVPMKKKNDQNNLQLEDLLQLQQYSMVNSVKDEALLRLVKDRLPIALKNPHIRSLFQKKGIDIDEIKKIEDIPFIPVQMFKHFDLSLQSGQETMRVIRSSGTSSGSKSIVPITKRTAANQIKGLKSILESFLGQKRRVMIVIDHARMNDPEREITARGAGIRGFSIFAKEIHYVLKEAENGELVLDMPVVRKLQKEYEEMDVYFFGFTYIIWKAFCRQMIDKGIKFRFKDADVFHGGGWKKMGAESVTREEFSTTMADILGTKPDRVHDFYGMAEQTGIIFVDCEYGNKHVPNFSQIIIRDIRTLQPCKPGEKGLIEVVGVLSDSYYSYAILTEDIGHVKGSNDCPCGRKGTYFVFDSRVEKAEIRGCGDTYRE